MSGHRGGVSTQGNSLFTKRGNRYCEHGFPNKTQTAADSLMLMRRSTKVMKEDINLKKHHFFNVIYISIGLDEF